MKTILVPTDFSEVAENAAKYAMELASFYEKAKVIFFHAYSVALPITDVPIMPSPYDEMEKECDRLIKSFDEKLRKIYRNIETELVIRPGFVVDEILYLLEKQNIDLVVMGVNGAGEKESVFGNAATSVMRAAKQPVFIIPKEARFRKPEKVAFGCDYTAIVPDSVTEKIKDFAKVFHAKILIFDMLKKAELITYEKAVAEINLENSLDDVPHSLYFPSGDNLSEDINSFVKINDADILIMMPHNYSFLQGLFHHSNTKTMAFRTHIPLLSIHE
ncbi:MAG: universal stress protein [Bacteroidia bacterium]